MLLFYVLRVSMVLRIGTDCSGIEAPLIALKSLNIEYSQIWRCDNDTFTNKTAEANFKKPNLLFTDITTRNNKKLPEIDLYVCGFPCQPFSTIGERKGILDPRSNVISAMLDTIKESKPKILILENVLGFKSISDGKMYSNLIEILSEKYSINASVYNTKKFGLPQNRQRIYFVGIRKDIQKKDFIKPKEKKMRALREILDLQLKGVSNIYKDRGYNIKTDMEFNIINTVFSTQRKIMYNIVPTIATNSNSHFIYELNRPLTIIELLLLQGFPKKFKQVVNNSQFKKQIGNSMSVPVLKYIIKEALKCI